MTLRRQTYTRMHQVRKDSWTSIFFVGWSHPTSQISMDTQICWRMGWPLNNRRFKEVTVLESKHGFFQEMPNSLSRIVTKFSHMNAIHDGVKI